jgi:hypothetical protein
MPAVELRPEETCGRLQNVVGATQFTVLLAQFRELGLLLGRETRTTAGVDLRLHDPGA